MNTYTNLDPRALHAARAAKNYRRWGAWAARRYAAKHGALQYLTLARVLYAAESL